MTPDPIPEPPGGPPPRWPALIVAGAGLLLYAATSFPHPDWLDGPELATAAFRLGIFHPPGAPLAVLIGHLSVLAPASPTLWLSCFSAAFAAAALYLLARLAQDLWRHLGPARGGPAGHLVVGLAAVTFLLSDGLWSQAVRLEVYTLALLLFVASLRELTALAVRAPGAETPHRAGRALAFVGMGLAVHPLMALPALAGFAALAVASPGDFRPVTAGRLLRMGRMLLWGAAPLLLLPLLVRAPVDLRWGDPTTPTGWLSFVLGTTFGPTFTTATATDGSTWWPTLAAVATGAGLPVTFAGLAGFYFLARSRWRLALLLATVGAASTLPLWLQRSVRLDNPDVTGYALVGMAVLFVAAVCALAVIARLVRARRAGAWAAAGLAAAAVLGCLVASTARRNRSGCRRGRAPAARTLEHLPEGSLVILGDFNLTFMLENLIRMEGLRTDVDVLYLRDLDNPPLRRWLAERDPEIEGLLPGAGDLSADRLERIAAVRPLALDLGPHLGSALPSSLVPAGLVWRVHAGIVPPETTLLARQRRVLGGAESFRCDNTTRDERTADVIAWHAYWQGLEAQRRGWIRLAAGLLATARCASPSDQTIAAALAGLGDRTHRGCGPEPGLAAGPPARLVPAAPRPARARALLLLIGLLGWAAPLAFSGRGWNRGIRCDALALLGLALQALALFLP